MAIQYSHLRNVMNDVVYGLSVYSNAPASFMTHLYGLKVPNLTRENCKDDLVKLCADLVEVTPDIDAMMLVFEKRLGSKLIGKPVGTVPMPDETMDADAEEVIETRSVYEERIAQMVNEMTRLRMYSEQVTAERNMMQQMLQEQQGQGVATHAPAHAPATTSDLAASMIVTIANERVEEAMRRAHAVVTSVATPPERGSFIDRVNAELLRRERDRFT